MSENTGLLHNKDQSAKLLGKSSVLALKSYDTNTYYI